MEPQIVFKSKKVITSSTPVPDLIQLLLENRQISDKQSFLHPLPPVAKAKEFNLDPEIFTNFIAKLKQHLSTNKNILIYGDYDADGITSTALLYLALSQHSSHILPFLPNREEDGYAIKYQSVQNFVQKKSFQADVILTIDNGISAKEEIAKLTQAGYEVMVIDHHLAGQATPAVEHILHSTVTSAAGLAWLVAKQFDPNSPLELAAIGVIADCMDLLGINRQIVVHGLRALSTTSNFGLKALLQITTLENKVLSTYDVAFGLAPRLNASGRLADPTDALRLLCTTSGETANKFAQNLNQHNQDRQILQQSSMDLVLSKINPDSRCFVVIEESLHPGVIGLVAGKLTETYYRPSLVLTRVGDVYKGSARSIPELHITQALEELRHLCIDLGGHAQAAGCSVSLKNILEFSAKLTENITKKLAKVDLQPKINCECSMELSAVSLNLIQALSTLEPFGFGNLEPLFYFENIQVQATRVLGANQNHLKLTFANNLDALSFSAPAKHFLIKPGDKLNLVARLSQNTYNNFTTPQLLVKYLINNSN